MLTFVGRKRELQKLHDLSSSKQANLVVINGRRRIGKSRLVCEFAKDKRFLSFTGLAPIGNVDGQAQLDTFADRLSENFEMPLEKFTNWTHAFMYLSKHLTNEPTVILFDEISWMGDQDPTFIPKLKNWWDLVLVQYPNLVLVLCGSVSTWIEKNIINSTALFGRINLQITLEEVSLSESATILRQLGFKGSTEDIFKILAVTGGVPWYLEQISAHALADDNIRRLCFEEDGFFTLEFDKIFHDLFNDHGSMYKKIVRILANGMKDLSEIRNALKGGMQPESLDDLMQALIAAGYVTQHFKTERISKQRLYRLSNNYLRFFLKYIEPNLSKIQQGAFQDTSLQAMPAWDTIMGLQVEKLLLNNRSI